MNGRSVGMSRELVPLGVVSEGILYTIYLFFMWFDVFIYSPVFLYRVPPPSVLTIFIPLL